MLEDVPVLLIHGDADRLIPMKAASRLAAAAPQGTRHLVIGGAGHGEPHSKDPDAWEAAAREVLRSAFARDRD